MIGIGGAGCKVAVESSNSIGCKCVLISNDKKDFNEHNCSIFINSKSWINPSNSKLRSFAQYSSEEIKSAIRGFQTAILIANLGGKAGSAMAPVISAIARECSVTSIISFVIMPFRYEKDRIFHAGVSLRRIRDSSDATIIVDNDALLHNNPELSPSDCYVITNNAVLDVINSLSQDYISPDFNLLCASKQGQSTVESSLKDSIGILFEDAKPDSVRKSVLYVAGSQNVPIGTLHSVVNTLGALFGAERSAEIAVSLSDSDKLRVNLMASIQEDTRFDRYDPLGEIIPKDNVLDWDELESSPDIELMISNLE